MNQRVGDLEGNAAAMLDMRAQAEGADLLLCPELQLTGYPPEDLVLKPEFVRRTMECAEQLVDATAEPGPAMLIGTIVNEGGSNYNAVILADGGRVHRATLKRELPNYGTFDEKRIFAPGPAARADRVPGREDRRADLRGHLAGGRLRHLAEAGAELLLVPNGSPYELDKDDTRQQLVRSRAPDRASDRLHQPRRRPGRAGVRRLVVRHAPRWRARRADARLGGSAAAHRLGADGRRLALRDPRKHALDAFPGGRLPGDDGRACAIMSSATAFPG